MENLLLPLQDWIDFIRKLDIDETIQTKLIQYIEYLSTQNLPVIFDSDHLSSILNLDREDLCFLTFDSKYFYRNFSIKKRTGGHREIEVPFPRLMAVQYWIKELILDKVPISPYAHGFVPLRSIKSHAISHVNSKYVLKMDIEDFFGSCQQSWVIQLFKDLGYSQNVTPFLSNLVTSKGRLAQGAPTSPVLSNILFKKVDLQLATLAESYNLTYTRYADDLCFSGEYVPKKLCRLVSKILRHSNFSPNEKKTFFGPISNANITGLRIDNGHLYISRNLKRQVRKDVHYILRHGLISHINKRRIRDTLYFEKLFGQLCYWRNIEPQTEFPRKALYALQGSLQSPYKKQSQSI